MGHGEHLRILVGGRYDHGIDCGDRTVLHLALPAGGGLPVVRRSLFPDFVRGAEKVEVVRHAERTHPPKMVVSRAFSKLGDTAVGAMFPSAEHFVAWCLTGLAPLAHLELPAKAGPGARAKPALPAAAKATAAPAKARSAAPAAKAPAKAPARPPAKAAAKPGARAAKRPPRPPTKAAKAPAKPAKRVAKKAKRPAPSPRKAAKAAGKKKSSRRR